MKKLFGLLSLVFALAACSPPPPPSPFETPAPPQSGDSWVTPDHPAPPVPTGPQISASALVTVRLDTTTAPVSALVTIKPGVALAAVRLRLSSGNYSPALGGADGVLVYAESPSVRVPLVLGGVVEVAPSRGGGFMPLIENPQPSVTFGGSEQSWLEVTAYQAERPLTGDSCTATASRLTTGQVSVISVGCAGISFATVHVIEASGRDTSELIGPQNLVITQRAQGVAVAEPTFRVLIEGKQIWPK